MIDVMMSPLFHIDDKPLEWFECLHEYLLDNLNDMKHFLEELPKLRLFKLAEGLPTSLSEGKIYRSVPANYSLGSVIRTLPTVSARTHKLLDMFGIQDASVKDVMDAIIKCHLERR